MNAGTVKLSPEYLEWLNRHYIGYDVAHYSYKKLQEMARNAFVAASPERPGYASIRRARLVELIGDPPVEARWEWR